MKAHTVVLGYGVKGRNAVKTLLNSGQDPREIVVVAMDRFAVADALKLGVVGVVGDGRSEEILRDAAVPTAASVVVAPDQDDNAIMMTLAARRLNPSAHIVAAARESAAADMLRQSGANTVITTSEAAGNLMGLSLNAPQAGLLVEDLLDVGRGLEIVEREVTREERGRSTAMVNERGELVLAVLRGDTVTRFDESGNELLGPGDRLVVIRPAKG